jgi:hypothetical protein
MAKENIYFLPEGGGLRPMAETSYANEDLLQKLLEDHPDLLAGDQINRTEPRRWVLVTREVAVPDSQESGGRWSLDHLFLDQDGIPTLVEVKRSSDTRIRREVVGQMLDYAANAVAYWSIEKIRSLFDQRVEAVGGDPSAEIAALLQEPDASPERISGYWQVVNTNLQAGRLRLVFLADTIPNELRQIVEFLNGQMSPAEVLAIELKQFAGEGGTVMVPRVMGQTAAAQRAKSVGSQEKRLWDEGSFFAEMKARHGDGIHDAARSLHGWCEATGLELRFGTGRVDGSITAGLPMTSAKGKPPGLFVMGTNGRITISLDVIRRLPPFDESKHMDALVERLRKIPEVKLSAADPYPSIPVAPLLQEEAMAVFKDAMKWVVDEIRAHAQ